MADQAGLSSELSGISTTLDALLKSQVATQASQIAIEASQIAMQSDMSGIRVDLTSITEKVNSLKEVQDRHTVQISGFATSYSNIQKDMMIKLKEGELDTRNTLRSEFSGSSSDSANKAAMDEMQQKIAANAAVAAAAAAAEFNRQAGVQTKKELDELKQIDEAPGTPTPTSGAKRPCPRGRVAADSNQAEPPRRQQQQQQQQQRGPSEPSSTPIAKKDAQANRVWLKGFPDNLIAGVMKKWAMDVVGKVMPFQDQTLIRASVRDRQRMLSLTFPSEAMAKDFLSAATPLNCFSHPRRQTVICPWLMEYCFVLRWISPSLNDSSGVVLENCGPRSRRSSTATPTFPVTCPCAATLTVAVFTTVTAIVHIPSSSLKSSRTTRLLH